MKLKTKIPLNLLDNLANEQIENAKKLSTNKEMAIMGDAHGGYSIPIGAVVDSSLIVPNYIGGDIGCGILVSLVKGLTPKDFTEQIKQKILKTMEEKIGINNVNCYTFIDEKNLIDISARHLKEYKIPSLGNGNHFIEIGNEGDDIYISVHTGSRSAGIKTNIEGRNLAKAIATGDEKAISKENETYGLPLFLNSEIIYEWFKLYQETMGLANRNRELLTYLVFDILKSQFPKKRIEIKGKHLTHHNFLESVGDKIRHRKGCVKATLGDEIAIASSMKDGIYILEVVENNEKYLDTAPHGAGRLLSRGVANKTLSMENFKTDMKGITAQVIEGNLDEAPRAYKDIHWVLDLHPELKVIKIIKPMINFKGATNDYRRKKRKEKLLKEKK